MSLDLSPLDNAIAEMETAMDYYESDLASRDRTVKRLLRTAVIKTFEFTYELSFKMLKRHLEQTSANPARFATMPFRAVLREAFQLDLVRSEVSAWMDYRALRNETSHVYAEERAQAVMDRSPDFLQEARYLRDRLHERNELGGAAD